MANTISLRTYLGELDVMLERESPTQVIGHCRYILQHFPQNVATYRLLAKALLQKAHNEGQPEQFEEAAQMFGRVLSVLPNDHIAHLGMSEINQQSENLDAAIWHMERAYEQLPGNTALQEVLRDLYAQRDGEDHVPEKIQLTRGALARQYISGQLYDQALIELRTALDRNADRIDLRVLLAETLWESQHQIEAGEVAIQVLKKLPNCLSANRILARLWLDNERPTDAQTFLDKLESLDPYAAASLIAPDADNVADVVTLPRLDYASRAQAAMSSETPEWVSELGDIGSDLDFEDAFNVPPPAQNTRTPLSEPAPSFGTDLFAEHDRLGPPRELPAAADWPLGNGLTDAEPNVPAWFVGDEPGWDAAELGKNLAPFGEEVPDWQSEEASDAGGVGPEASAIDAGWLFEEEETTAEMFPPASGQTTPGDWPDPLEADWLEGEVPSDFDAMSIDLDSESPTLLEPPLSDGQPAQASNFSFDDLWEEDSPQSEPSADWTPSGFTGLLEGLAASGQSDQRSQEPDPVPPEWVASFGDESDDGMPATDGFTGMSPEQDAIPTDQDATELFDWDMLNTPDQAPSDRNATEPLTPPPAADGTNDDDMPFGATFDETALAEEMITPTGSDADTETGEEADFEAFSDEQPVADSASVAMSGAIRSPEWLPDTGSLSELNAGPGMETDASAASEETEDWLAQLGVAGTVDEEHTQMMSETPEDRKPEYAPQDDDWLGGTADLGDTDLLDALGAFDEGAVTGRLDVSPSPGWDSESTGNTGDRPPEQSGQPAEEDMFALFDSSPGSDSAFSLDEWSQFEADDAARNVNDVQNSDSDWGEVAADADDDWLGSFAKPEPPAEEMFEETDSTPISDDPLIVRPDQFFEESDNRVSDDEWLAHTAEVEPEPEIEGASDATRLLSELDDMPLDEGSIESLFDDITPEDVSQDDLLQDDSAVAESDGPAWLAGIAPVETASTGPRSDVLSSLLNEPYDPFEGGSADQIPQYLSAKDTGILQPDEKPDWMAAFTGELLPDPEEALDVNLDLDVDAVTEDAFTLRDDDQIAEHLQDAFGAMADDAAAVSDQSQDAPESAEFEAYELEEETPPEDDGPMPEWLLAIANSEADKLDETLFDEPGQYGSAEATGVLQPDSEDDWFTQMGEESEAPAVSEPGVSQPESVGDQFDDAAMSEVLEETFSEADMTPDWLLEETQGSVPLANVFDEVEQDLVASPTENALDGGQDVFDTDQGFFEQHQTFDVAPEERNEPVFPQGAPETFDDARPDVQKPITFSWDSQDDEAVPASFDDEDIFGSPTSFETEISSPALDDLREELGVFDFAAGSGDSDEFGFADEPEIEAEDLFAQAPDLAHTSATLLEEDAIGEEAEPVPDDFSFGDWLPIWLREPIEDDPNGGAGLAASQDSPEPPEWLRDVFEDDES